MTRKDNKGRNLRNGESQRADGRYMYRYQDAMTGKRVTIYDTDLARLREQERKIRKDLDDHIVTDTAIRKLTVNELFGRYLSTKRLKERTRMNYQRMWNLRMRDTIGSICVVKLKPSHIRTLYAALTKEGLTHNTIKYLHTLLYPCLEMAVDDDIIRKNPAKGLLSDYGVDGKELEALTEKEQAALLAFAEESNIYSLRVPMIQIMIGTCCRVGEIIALTWSDVDMKNRTVQIGGALSYLDTGDGYRFEAGTTKTDAGVRTIPMTDEVYEAFRRQRELNFMLGSRSRVEVGDRSDFVFVTKTGRPVMPAGVNSFLKNVVRAYNRVEDKLAEKERRAPVHLPHISAHVLRHTGCTRMAERGVDPKVMQYVMGHAQIAVTMDVYNHIAEMRRVETEMAKMNLKNVV